MPPSERAHGSRQNIVLAAQYARSQRLGRVIGLNLDGRLCNHRTVVELGRNKVDCRTMHATTSFYGTGMRVQSRERRQKTGMNIDQPTRIAIDKAVGQDTHETGQHHQMGLMGIYQRGQCGIKRFAAGKVTVRERMGGNATVAGQIESRGLGFVAQHSLHLKNRPVVRVFQQRLQIGASPGNQHDQARRRRGAAACRNPVRPCRRKSLGDHADSLPSTTPPLPHPCCRRKPKTGLKPYNSGSFKKQPPPRPPMHIRYRPSCDGRPLGRGAAVTIGNFDGVHRGHSELFSLISATARQQNLRSCVLTFEPHPRAFFSPDAAPARISSLRDRLAWIRAHGIDEVRLLRFDQRLAGMSPHAFIEEVLVAQLHTRHLWVGDDFRFGQKRAGDFNTLQLAGQQHGFDVAGIQSVVHANRRVSSTDIRLHLTQGNIAAATEALGHPITYSGHVVHGQKLGRTLGFPTLNLRLGFRSQALSGILAVWVHGIEEKPLPGVASLGVRPSVKSTGEYWLETFLPDWSGDAYGRNIQIEVVSHIRPEARFDSLDALIVQMKRDTEQALATLQQCSPSIPLFNLRSPAAA